jgi:hypothetical protein
MQSNKESVTTKLEVGFLFHLPYRTWEGNSASLMIATGPNVSVNTFIGLPFMKAMGMILNLIDEVVDCKYLDCPPFPVDFRWTSNHVPGIDDQSSTPANHAASYIQMIQEVKNLEHYYEAKVLASGSMMTPKACRALWFKVDRARHGQQPRRLKHSIAFHCVHVCAVGSPTRCARGLQLLPSQCPWEGWAIVTYSLLASVTYVSIHCIVPLWLPLYLQP